jgi:hypothetical protein
MGIGIHAYTSVHSRRMFRCRISFNSPNIVRPSNSTIAVFMNVTVGLIQAIR